MKQTKIVCTLGPASNTVTVIRQLIRAGMNVGRLNFSHGDHESHRQTIRNLREAAALEHATIGILLDTKGPEIRVGKFKDGSVELHNGDVFILTAREVEGDERAVSITYKPLPREVGAGQTILLDDGLMELKVDMVRGEDVICHVVKGGTLKNNKGVNLPGFHVNLPAVTEKDLQDLLFGIEEGVDFVAASFVRGPEDVLAIRKVLEDNGGHHIEIISKIENNEGVQNFDKILEFSDGIMVARGDLGVEIPPEKVPLLQKDMISRSNRAGRVVITATQMLDSMIHNPRPTRAEASDVANAILDGSDAIMLSGETASGRYPVEAVQMMARIAAETEPMAPRNMRGNEATVTNAISLSVCEAARMLGAKAVITPTQSGYTASYVASRRPGVPVLAASTDEGVLHRMSLRFGVQTLLTQRTENTDEMIEEAVFRAKEAGFVQDGDLVIVTAGIPVNVHGTTNMMKVQLVGDAYIKGQGLGRESVTGTVVRVSSTEEAKTKLFRDAILVTERFEEEWMPHLQEIAGLVCGSGGLTAVAAMRAREAGVAVIWDVNNVMKRLRDYETVTVNPAEGMIYRRG